MDNGKYCYFVRVFFIKVCLRVMGKVGIEDFELENVKNGV